MVKDNGSADGELLFGRPSGAMRLFADRYPRVSLGSALGYFRFLPTGEMIAEDLCAMNEVRPGVAGREIVLRWKG